MATKSSPGRPRDPQVDRAILEAALELLGEVGFNALTVEGVASRAGVGKATIYRRYSSKEELVRAALGKVGQDPEVPDSGSTLDDVIEIAVEKWSQLTEGAGPTMLGTFLTQWSTRPELLDEFRKAVILPRQGPLRAVLERGVTRGEIRTDIEVDIAMDLVAGALLSGFIFRGDTGRKAIEKRVRAVWPALEAR